MTLKWIAPRLKIGAWANVSNCLVRRRKEHGAADAATKRSSRLVSFEDEDENLPNLRELLCMVA
jgi:hypothetical protein